MNTENRLKILKVADKLFKQGKIDAAIKEYQKILEIKRDDLEVRRIIGDLLIKLNRLPEAIHQFEWIADYYLKEGFHTKAIAMYKRISRIDPKNEDIPLKLADLYSKQGLIIEAKQIYLELAEEYKRQKNQKKALGIYKKILEFDRHNIKMRLLLAENYLRENMVEEATAEYMVASDILIKKKEFKQAEEILAETHKKIKSLKIFDKLISCYIAQGDERRAIQMLESLGPEIARNMNLLKILGELYFKNNMIDEAEKIYKRVADVDPNETEVIMKLGKVYLQREEYDKTYQLFLPTIDRFITESKFDEANSLLRFIITSNNTYLPALHKLASIFKATDKTNSLIALYESMLPIFEQKKMKPELIAMLKELTELSNSPFAYQEQLARLTGEGAVEEESSSQEREFIDFHLKNVDDAVGTNDFQRAVSLLETAKSAFPDNVDIRLKLFDVHQLSNNVSALLNEGMELLQIYKSAHREQEYRSLHERLMQLKPSDERLLEIDGRERTNIEIDFDHDELIEQIDELKHPEISELELGGKKTEEEDVLILTGEDSLPAIPIKGEKVPAKGLSSHLVELDFYISEGYFDDAEKILEKLKKEYPESREIISRLERVRKGKSRPQTKTEEIKIAPLGQQSEEAVEIISSITEELDMFQKYEDSKAAIEPELFSGKQGNKIPAPDFLQFESPSFEIELDDRSPSAAEELPLFEMDNEQIVQSPSAKPKERKSEAESLGSSADFLDIDDILSFEESPPLAESPFREISDSDFSIESGEEMLKEGLLLEEEQYYEVESAVAQELSAIRFWVKELDKLRVSTIEKNMMEIFKEFKKGVDEKIGREDYETRYNLGIAYKEMGLVEEAIHEFLISAKHPLKFFDSAGLLGICFREKGMLEESVGWFEKALNSPERKEEEYKAVKYELVITARLKEDYPYAQKVALEILRGDPEYRNIRDIYSEIKKKL